MQDQSITYLKLYGKNSSQIDSLVQTVCRYSEDIQTKFGIDKCAVIELERGRLVRSEGIVAGLRKDQNRWIRKGVSTMGYFR